MGLYGPGMTGIPQGGPRPLERAAPAVPRSPFFLMPAQPGPGELAGTIEHLTGRPADPAEVQQVMDHMDMTREDYASGGETGSQST